MVLVLDVYASIGEIQEDIYNRSSHLRSRNHFQLRILPAPIKLSLVPNCRDSVNPVSRRAPSKQDR